MVYTADVDVRDLGPSCVTAAITNRQLSRPSGRAPVDRECLSAAPLRLLRGTTPTTHTGVATTKKLGADNGWSRWRWGIVWDRSPVPTKINVFV